MLPVDRGSLRHRPTLPVAARAPARAIMHERSAARGRRPDCVAADAAVQAAGHAIAASDELGGAVAMLGVRPTIRPTYGGDAPKSTRAQSGQKSKSWRDGRT